MSRVKCSSSTLLKYFAICWPQFRSTQLISRTKDDVRICFSLNSLYQYSGHAMKGFLYTSGTFTIFSTFLSGGLLARILLIGALFNLLLILLYLLFTTGLASRGTTSKSAKGHVPDCCSPQRSFFNLNQTRLCSSVGQLSQFPKTGPA